MVLNVSRLFKSGDERGYSDEVIACLNAFIALENNVVLSSTPKKGSTFKSNCVKNVKIKIEGQ